MGRERRNVQVRRFRALGTDGRARGVTIQTPVDDADTMSRTARPVGPPDIRTDDGEAVDDLGDGTYRIQGTDMVLTPISGQDD